MGGKSTLRTRQKGKKAPTVAKLKKTAWKLLSEVIRGEARNHAGNVHCYTCGVSNGWNMGMQAGHAIPGRTGATLLDEEIIRPQCQRCNIWLGGNYPVFTTKLIREKEKQIIAIPMRSSMFAAQEALDWWEAKLISAKQVKKWTRSDLEAKCEEYRERLAALG